MTASRDEPPPRLRLIPGGRERRVGGVTVITAREDRRPFPVDARVVEEDTWRVVGADPALPVGADPAIRVLEEVGEAGPEPLGSVTVHGSRPLMIVAIVYDLDADPICRPEGIERTLMRILDIVSHRNVRSLGLPPLGVRHGGLGRRRFDALLEAALEARRPPVLRRIWLVLPPDAGGGDAG